MKDMRWNYESQSTLYTKRNFYNNGKKNYLSKRYHKGQNSKHFEGKNEPSDKRICFYCKKPSHLIKDYRLRIAPEKKQS